MCARFWSLHVAVNMSEVTWWKCHQMTTTYMQTFSLSAILTKTQIIPLDSHKRSIQRYLFNNDTCVVCSAGGNNLLPSHQSLLWSVLHWHYRYAVRDQFAFDMTLWRHTIWSPWCIDSQKHCLIIHRSSVWHMPQLINIILHWWLPSGLIVVLNFLWSRFRFSINENVVFLIMY